MPNRLIDETSPYLIQHAHNPVDWYPWGDEAFEKARSEDKPVFLSIGYSACHWCHVMERESFEDPAVAAILNREFVSIKVDREERPDVDAIYMQAVQMMTGHGGWPMSMFLTPDAVPFFGGTYFPPRDRHGLPSFTRVIEQLAAAWRDRRMEVLESGTQMREALARSMETRNLPAEELSTGMLDAAAAELASSYDPVDGGFGAAPKFPPSMSLDFLMQVARRTGDAQLREIVVHTLRRMACGGIYDQLGGGFHRYSTDARWLAPHFEKMLYDNALLARLYLRAWQWTKEPLFARIARETLAFVAREMTSPEGGFYSTLDADSEGVEGKFYVWSLDELVSLLGEENGRAFAALYDVTRGGNWEGANILHRPRDLKEVASELGVSESRLLEIEARAKPVLLAARERRVRPGRDEKILAGWNGWTLAAFADAALAFDSAEYREIAERNARFLLGAMRPGGVLHRSRKDGRTRIPALLEDYGGAAWGLLAAFEATQQRELLEGARELAGVIRSRFADPAGGPFWDTPEDHETLIVRPRDSFDNATPSGNALAAAVLLRLALWLDDDSWADAARPAVVAMLPLARRYPSAFGFLLGECAEWMAGTPKEIAITGPRESVVVHTLLQVVGETWLPQRLLAFGDANDDLPLMKGKPAEREAAWVCRNYSCAAPTDDPEELRALLES